MVKLQDRGGSNLSQPLREKCPEELSNLNIYVGLYVSEKEIFPVLSHEIVKK